MKILFIFHDYNISGGTIALYRNIVWLKKNGVEVGLFVTGNGKFERKIHSLGTCFFWNEKSTTPKSKNLRFYLKRIKSIFNKAQSYREAIIDKIKKEEFDLIYANTIVTSNYIQELKVLNIPIVWHIHELELAINVYGVYHLEANKFVNHIIANSYSTYNFLINMHGFNQDKISVHYPSININEINEKKDNNFNIFKDLGIKSNSFIVGYSGTGIYRKGVETFIELAKIMDTMYPEYPVHFVWVGNVLFEEEIEYDIKKAGLQKKISFTGNLNNPIPYYQAFDVFVSLSKEESFGLAAVETALLEKPIIFFQNTGGLPEIFGENSGGNIPYLDLIAMVKQIIVILNDKELKQKYGKFSRKIAMKFDEEIILPELFKTLKKIVN